MENHDNIADFFGGWVGLSRVIEVHVYAVLDTNKNTVRS